MNNSPSHPRFLKSGLALISSLILFLLLPAAAQAQDYTYTTNAGAITITGYTGAGGAVVIPDTINGLPVTAIGGEAFANNTSLTSVTIGTNVTTIGGNAFIYCTSLTSVTIPNSVTSIGFYAFAYCTSLASITVDAANPAYSSDVAGVLFNKIQTVLIQCPGGKAGSYTIPNSVTIIRDYAFIHCYSLTSVTIPNSVTSIPRLAFAGCTSLTSVTIPNSVTSIGDSAFDFCISLTSVTIGNGVTSIGNWAFACCANLTAVYFRGNAPTSVGGLFDDSNQVIVYYLPGTTGWGAIFAGRPTAPFAVSTSSDSGPGSLRQVLANAEDGATIDFDPSLDGQTITLTSGGIVFANSVTLDASVLARGMHINGNQNGSVFTIPVGLAVTLKSLTITNGSDRGIINGGALALFNCTVSGNQSLGDGGGIYSSATTLAMTGCTVSGNTGNFGGGLWIGIGGTGSFTNCTFAGNIARFGGGAISTYANVQVTVSSCTLSGNAATTTGGGLYNDSATTTLLNSIVAGNTAPADPDLSNNSTLITGGVNLTNSNPLLAPLGDYGGPTQTMPPLPGSPAIDAGDPLFNGSGLTDQRGLPRVADGDGNGGAIVDIGAVEIVAPPTITRGFVRQDLYTNIGSGVLVSDLTSNPAYPNSPSETSFIQSLEGPLDQYDNYGVMISGFIIADVSGPYHFWMSSDDGGEFWLSTDESPANLVLLASEPVWNGSRDYTTTDRRNPTAPENQSKTLFPGGINLVAGQPYYFKALMKEGSGGDNLAVAWQVPGGPEPVAGSAPIGGRNLGVAADPVGASVQISGQPQDVQVTLPCNAGPTETSTATFNVTAQGETATDPNSPLAYQWERSGNLGNTWAEVPGASGSSLTIDVTEANAGDLYRSIVYTPGAQAASAAATIFVDLNCSQFGDVNADGRTFLDDFAIMKANFGADVTGRSEGDVNGDGVVNSLDLLILVEHFGHAFTPPMGLPNGGTSGLTLRVRTDGTIDIVNRANAPVSISGYSIYSSSGGLSVDAWLSIDDRLLGDSGAVTTTLGGEVQGFYESNPTSELLSELNFWGQATFQPGVALGMGRPNTGPADDVRFFYVDQSGQLWEGVVDAADLPTPQKLQQPPVNRYSFSGADGDATDRTLGDSIGGQNGQVKGAGATFASGRLILPGGSSATQAYGDLPNGLLSVNSTNNGGSGEVTIEGWVKVTGNQSWSRLFDFGSSGAAGAAGEVFGPGGGGIGLDYLFYSAQIGGDTTMRRLEVRNEDPAGGGITTVDFATATFNSDLHFVVTWKESSGELIAYENGLLVASRVVDDAMSDINDVNVWLGRSNWTADQNTQGEYDEFRIYNHVLTPGEVLGNFQAGPDQLVGFVITPGFVRQDLYTNIGSGVLVSDLTSNPAYPNSPSETSFIQSLEGPLNLDEEYGVMLSGFIIPDVSGPYHFWMSSDDGGEFWLSTDESPANLVLLASEPQWNGSRDYTTTERRNPTAPENQSKTLFPDGINLVAGQPYYFKALMKENNGGDNLAVAWQVPGGPEPVAGSAPIGGANLAVAVNPTGAGVTITQQPSNQSVPCKLGGEVLQEAFENGLPAGFTLIGNATVDSTGGVEDSGKLSLTSAAIDQRGVAIIEDFNGGAPVTSFTARFKVRLGDSTCCTDGAALRPADGMSFNFAANIPNTLFADSPSGDLEEGGAGSGLRVTFDTWDSGAGDEDGPGIGIWYNRLLIANVSTSEPNPSGKPLTPIPTDPATGQPLALYTGAEFANVEIKLKAGGIVDVWYKNILVLANVATGYAPISGGRFALAARTGGANETHFVDDLEILINAGEATPVPPTFRTFNVAASGHTSADPNSPLTYQWERSSDGGGTWAEIAGASGSSLALRVTEANVNNLYRSIVYTPGAQATSDAVGFFVPINNAPIISASDVAVDVDAGPQSIAGHVNVSSGPEAYEAGQAVTLVMSNDNPGLFSGQPAVDGSGTLTFTTAPGAGGSAKVTMVATDDGGVSCDGVDTSSTTFVINVKSVIAIRPITVSLMGAVSLYDVNNLINGNGLGSPINTGDPLPAGVMHTWNVDWGLNNWVSTDPGGFPSDWFAAAGTIPTFVFDLGEEIEVRGAHFWNYGGSSGFTGAVQGNAAKSVELRFNRAAEGNAVFAGPAVSGSLNHAPLMGEAPGFVQPRQDVALDRPITARYVEVRITDNWFVAPGDGTGQDEHGHPVAGGDRVGLGEVRFSGATTVPRIVHTGANQLPDGSIQSTFNSDPGVSFIVLASTQVAKPLNLWNVLGIPSEGPAGHYQFTDPQAWNFPQRFYAVIPGTLPPLRWASRVLGFSSEYASEDWSAEQLVGPPDTYPNYGDFGTAWASLSSDDQPEFIELGFDAPAPIHTVSIYETFAPGAVNRVSVRNPNSGEWVEVWSGSASAAPAAARIFTVTFPVTPFPVDAVRIEMDSPAVTDWNEIDAVGINW